MLDWKMIAWKKRHSSFEDLYLGKWPSANNAVFSASLIRELLAEGKINEEQARIMYKLSWDDEKQSKLKR